MEIEARVKYYLGNLYLYHSFKKRLEYSFEDYEKDKMISYHKTHYIDKDILHSNNYDNQIRHYISDLRKIINNAELNDYKILIKLGDLNCKLDKFTFTKTRPIDMKNNYNILLNLNTPRHWGCLWEVDKYDIPFTSKQNKIIWRGTNTGDKDSQLNLRYQLISKYQNYPNKNIDVRFSHLSQYNDSSQNFIFDKMSIKDLLQNKFLISVEGNDVATNLKWIMYSNSVVIMPKPKIASWFMEDTLIPDYHYIEVKSDFSDLEEKFTWCCKNLDKCEKITKNAKLYVGQFLNEDKEKEIEKKIIDIYTNIIDIKLINSIKR